MRIYKVKEIYKGVCIFLYCLVSNREMYVVYMKRIYKVKEIYNG